MIPMLTILLTLVTILSVVPFHLHLSGRYEGRFDGSIAVTWLWGLLGLDYQREEMQILIGGKPVLRKARHGRPGRKREAAPPAKKKKAKTWVLFHLPFLFTQARKICRSLSPQGGIKGTIGLGDPAATGMFLGMAAGFFSWLPFLTIEPDFEEERFRWEGRLNLRILLISLSALAAQFLLTREGREIILNL